MSGSYRWPIVLGIAGLALFILATWTFVQGFGGWHTTFQGPGTISVEIPEAGDYRLWHESKTTIDGKLQVVDDELPSGSSIEFTDARGATTPIEPIRGNMSQEIGNTRRVALGRIEIAEPSTYNVTITGFQEPRQFRLSEIRLLAHFLRALIFALPGTILVIIALIWGITLAFRRRDAGT